MTKTRPPNSSRFCAGRQMQKDPNTSLHLGRDQTNLHPLRTQQHWKLVFHVARLSLSIRIALRFISDPLRRNAIRTYAVPRLNQTKIDPDSVTFTDSECPGALLELPFRSNPIDVVRWRSC
jgi:hypothetical protein